MTSVKLLGNSKCHKSCFLVVVQNMIDLDLCSASTTHMDLFYNHYTFTILCIDAMHSITAQRRQNEDVSEILPSTLPLGKALQKRHGVPLSVELPSSVTL